MNLMKFFVFLYLFSLNIFCQSFFAKLKQFKNLKKIFLNNTFTEIVPIGSCCILKYHVRSYCQKNSLIENENFLFDWMVVLNYTLFAEALKNNFTDAFQKDSLTVTRGSYANKDLIFLYNAKYKFEFVHALNGIKPFRLTQTSFEENYPLLEKKYEYLSQKTFQAFQSEKRTIYVGYACNLLSDPNGQRQEDFVQVLRSIKQRRDSNFLMLVLVTEIIHKINNYDLNNLIEKNLIFHQVKFYNWADRGIKDSMTQWQNIFEELMQLS